VTTALNLADVDALTGGGIGQFDAACPQCGPSRSSSVNQRRRVLRIWRLERSFATYHCARCEFEGFAHDRSAAGNITAFSQLKTEAQQRQDEAAADSLKRARGLWSLREPIASSIAEIYLRACRGYHGYLPGTLGFLPARGKHGPAMIAAFGLAREPSPGEIVIDDVEVRGVHLTKLKLEGSAKAGTEADKIMIGRSNRSPIVLASINDGLGLAITEGIEDALSVHEVTGLGAWAAGAAGRLPAMAAAVPSYVTSVAIVADEDERGRVNSGLLARLLTERGIEVLMVRPGAPRSTS
jgi:Toprim domain-containing protein